MHLPLVTAVGTRCLRIWDLCKQIEIVNLWRKLSSYRKVGSLFLLSTFCFCLSSYSSHLIPSDPVTSCNPARKLQKMLRFRKGDFDSARTAPGTKDDQKDKETFYFPLFCRSLI